MLFNRRQIRFPGNRCSGSIRVNLRFIEQEAQLFASVTNLVFFAGRTEPLLTQKRNSLRQVFYLLGKLCIRLQEVFVFLSGDNYGVGVHAVLSLVFVERIIPYLRYIYKRKHQ